jgi:predicted DNA-binding mobile mystery protein A
MAAPSPRATRQATRQLDDTLRAAKATPAPPSGGWVRTVREVLGMNYSQLGKRLGISRQAVHKLEDDEVRGSASFERIRRAAEALDCRLVYALVPKSSLEEAIERQARKQAKRRLERVNISQALEASALDSESFRQQLDDLANELMVNRPSSLWDDRP